MYSTYTWCLQMTYKIVCSNCNTTLYLGYDLKSTREVLKNTDRKCRKCKTHLSPCDSTIEVKRKST